MKAFTLIEIMIAAALMLILLGAAVMVLYVGESSWQIDAGLLSLQQAGRQAMHGMVREIRQIDNTTNITITNTTYGSSITFRIIDNTNSINYSLNSDKQIIRTHAGSTRVLASDINELDFCCAYSTTCDTTCTNAQSVEIQLNATKTVRNKPLSYSLLERVELRNE
jgi:prepilin-type N-terminal cleavage/methylation domain-containing protein